MSRVAQTPLAFMRSLSETFWCALCNTNWSPHKTLYAKHCIALFPITNCYYCLHVVLCIGHYTQSLTLHSNRWKAKIHSYLEHVYHIWYIIMWIVVLVKNLSLEMCQWQYAFIASISPGAEKCEICVRLTLCTSVYAKRIIFSLWLCLALFFLLVFFSTCHSVACREYFFIFIHTLFSVVYILRSIYWRMKCPQLNSVLVCNSICYGMPHFILSKYIYSVRLYNLGI